MAQEVKGKTAIVTGAGSGEGPLKEKADDSV